MARTVRTKSGRVLDAADIEALADKAERGVDLAHWQPRRGRPSLSPTTLGHSPRVGARVPEDLYRRAMDRASTEGKSISEVVRDALTAYAEGAQALGDERQGR